MNMLHVDTVRTWLYVHINLPTYNVGYVIMYSIDLNIISIMQHTE